MAASSRPIGRDGPRFGGGFRLGWYRSTLEMRQDRRRKREMETIKMIEGLDAAIKLLSKASKANANGSLTIWRITDHAQTHLDKQIAALLAPDHAKDSDCTVNPDTDLCTVCGVMRSDPCPVCGGRSFHLDGCDESDATPNNRHQREAEQRTRTGNTPTCEDCGKDYDHCDCDERDPADVLDYQPGD